MARQVTATEAKARLLALLDDIEDGESIEITRHVRLVARLVPACGAHALRGRMTILRAILLTGSSPRPLSSMAGDS